MQENNSLIKVDAKIIKSIAISFYYNNDNCSSIILSENDVVRVSYIDITKNKLIEIKGRINSINPSYSLGNIEDNVNSYNIEIDCSRPNQSDIRVVQVVNIREITIVTPENEIMPLEK